MLWSVVICSVRPELLKEAEANIRATIGAGIEYEIIAIDNSAGRPLAQVYNEGARRSSGRFLLFMHEDAGFLSSDWGKELARLLSPPETGVIGFAGSRVMVDAPGGFNVSPEWTVWRMTECGVPRSLNIDPESPVTPVAVLDGYMLAVRREVWEEMPFDEELLTGFHCYDMDFTLSVGRKYRNYVAGRIDTYHNSSGHFGADWLRATGSLYRRKWRGMLPACVPDSRLEKHPRAEKNPRAKKNPRAEKNSRLEKNPRAEKNLRAEKNDISRKGIISEKELSYHKERVWFRYLKACLREGVECKEYEREFWRLPLTPRHAGHLLKLLWLRRRRLTPSCKGRG